MKATGIVRRLDDLGRIVIPKEIRRSQHLVEGDPMEIFLDGGNIILQKYEPLTTAVDFIDQAIEILAEQKEHEDFRQILLTISYALKNPFKEDEDGA